MAGGGGYSCFHPVLLCGGSYLLLLLEEERMNDKYNDPLHFRPNDEDMDIINAIKSHLAKSTLVKPTDTFAFRYLLRYWWKETLEIRRDAHDKLYPPDEEQR